MGHSGTVLRNTLLIKNLDILSEGFYKYQGLNSGLSLGLAKKQVVFFEKCVVRVLGGLLVLHVKF